ncbi:hypothetical protein FISHEDRAFT_77405 [Fistulina hepatica ATCC 64428]|uniref:Uncharacterized protein n=1 Tax=Fistulina hepatica ATCC 64428 TaxID=1128425 RepID=A0A0D7A2I8_9AGAR|nr:hypothetical protein FISHEDRAFT_77405 [Fistulina hepatica ATCC 64428]
MLVRVRESTNELAAHPALSTVPGSIPSKAFDDPTFASPPVQQLLEVLDLRHPGPLHFSTPRASRWQHYIEELESSVFNHVASAQRRAPGSPDTDGFFMAAYAVAKVDNVDLDGDVLPAQHYLPCQSRVLSTTRRTCTSAGDGRAQAGPGPHAFRDSSPPFKLTLESPLFHISTYRTIWHGLT